MTCWSRSSFVLVGVFWIFAGCGEEISDDAEVPSLTETLSDILPTAKKQENTWRDDLMGKAKRLAKQLRSVTTGTPIEVQKATENYDKIVKERDDKIAKLYEPVQAAQDELDALDKSKSRGYYANTRRRCGDDGCGNICESKCQADEVCRGNWCSCVPDCANRVCGSDGCGGYCGTGTCADGATCSKDGACVPDEAVKSQCRANCRSEVMPYEETTRYKSSVGYDRGTKRRSRPYTDFTDIGELRAYLDAVNTRAAAHARELAELETLESQVATAKQALADMQTKQKELRATSTELTKQKFKQQMEVYKAKQKAPETVELLTAAFESTKTMIETNKTEQAEVRKQISEQKKTVTKLSSALRKSAKRIKTLRKAKSKLDSEIALMTAEASEWAARIAAIEAAQAKLDGATKVFEAGKQKLMDEYKDQVASAKQKLDNLLKPAFPEEIIPIWNGDSPTAAASSFVLEIGKNSRLSQYVASVRSTANHWRGEYNDLSKDEAKIYEELTFGKPKMTWAQWNQTLADQETFCAALEDATNRLIGIQRTMRKTRDRIGR